MGDWDGIDRRRGSEFTTYRFKVLEDNIAEVKKDVKESKDEMKIFMKDMIEMRVELKQIVNDKAVRTSGWVSLVFNVIGGIILFFLLEKQ